VQNSKLNILILGMPLTGKSTLGINLSTKLNLDFNDLDILIESKYKKSVNTIFSKYGEKTFREYEVICLTELSKKNNHVLSLGGGSINNISEKLLTNFNIKIWLKATTDILVKRFNDSKKDRPLLKTKNPYNELLDIYNKRFQSYKKNSNIVIDVEDKSTNQISNEIIIKLNEIN